MNPKCNFSLMALIIARETERKKDTETHRETEKQKDREKERQRNRVNM